MFPYQKQAKTKSGKRCNKNKSKKMGINFKRKLSSGVFPEIMELIREYGSTLYVGLARAVSPTNTNFRLTFLLTRLQEALYEDLAV